MHCITVLNFSLKEVKNETEKRRSSKRLCVAPDRRFEPHFIISVFVISTVPRLVERRGGEVFLFRFSLARQGGTTQGEER
jgi:hypothetical protein